MSKAVPMADGKFSGATGDSSREAGTPHVAETFQQSSEDKWAARLVGAGSLLTLLYEVAFLILDRRFLSLSRPPVLIFHLINIALFAGAVVMTANVGPWIQRNWKLLAFSFSSAMIASSTCIALVTGEKEPLFIALMLFLAGTGPFLSWGERTQALLSIVAFISFTIVAGSLPKQPFDAYQLLGILIAAAIGMFSTALERRLRRARRHAEAEMLKGRETLMVQERLRLAGQLASGIAHDLNNTLNVIRLRLATLAQDESVQAGHAERLEVMDRAIEDAARTVSRVRELGRGGGDSQREPAQLAEVIAQALDLARSSIEETSSLHGAPIKIESHVPSTLPYVKGPASDLRQVFLNLLLNASEAMQRHGKIKMDSAVESDAVTVRVSDDGSGIPPEHLARIFEPFFTTKGAHGTGLGLSIARSIMDDIGGSISASNKPSGGAVFTLKFPFAAPSLAPKRRTTAKPAGDGCHFLIIDDDLQNLDALRESLAIKGHKVDTACSGVEAIEKIRSGSSYDIVLCDLGMPGMNGWEVARQAREIADKLDFYIVTGWSKNVEVEKPSTVSISGVLSKPLDLDKIEQLAAAYCPN
ncbi:MAG TPA: ATP-binding protein [Candidatus Binataceae bacterium]|nr:ATP-binding protein [Candidatus Binataceae bacterium]